MACYYIVFVIMFFYYSFIPKWVVGKQVPCYFIFGDSLVDDGNNNFLATFAKATYLPHGIDFRTGPTGRFCNGRTFADFTAELLGFKNYIPPYVSSNDSDILLGLNYASAAAGIRNETGQHLGARIDFDHQLMNHNITISRISEILGGRDPTSNYLHKCFYHVGFGSNDYLNNYFIPTEYSTSNHYTTHQFTMALIQQYRSQLFKLYDYGARKVALVGVGPLGCTPFELARHDANGSLCIDFINIAVQEFNQNLKLLVDELNNNTRLQGAKFIYLNFYDMSVEAIQKPLLHGFKVTDSACCGTGVNNGGVTCVPLEIPCENRNDYFFWDAYHPTEASNAIAARRTYNAQNISDAYPFDINHLLHY